MNFPVKGKLECIDVKSNDTKQSEIKSMLTAKDIYCEHKMIHPEIWDYFFL